MSQTFPESELQAQRDKFYATVADNQKPSETHRFTDPFMKDQQGNHFLNEWTASRFNSAPGATHADDPNRFKVTADYYNEQSMKYYDKVQADLEKLQGSSLDAIRDLITQAYKKIK